MMPMPASGDTLRKMIALTDGSGDNGLTSAAEALDLATARTARQLFDIKAGVRDVIVGQNSLAELLESRPDPSLMLLVNGPNGQRGLLTIDGLLINALVELATGAGDKQVYRVVRRPTMIDIALVGEFCETLLKLLPSEVAELALQPVLPHLSLGPHEVDPVKLAFLLDKGRYAVIAAEVGFQEGIRGGGISLALPVAFWMPKGGGQTGNAQPFADAMTRNLAASPLRLRAVLETVPLPLGRALSLGVGDCLPINSASLSDLTLVAVDGTKVMKGRLGQKAGKKAVSVSEILLKGGSAGTDIPRQQPASLPKAAATDLPGDSAPSPPAAPVPPV
ncbi:MAG: FliM/FliN family flagellar motor switch protein [Rhodobacteraceae bacterium]|nr:FliM/FliN family flagellar motor switch protein [Paracoccaceae bacterium]